MRGGGGEGQGKAVPLRRKRARNVNRRRGQPAPPFTRPSRRSLEHEPSMSALTARATGTREQGRRTAEALELGLLLLAELGVDRRQRRLLVGELGVEV